MSVLIHIVTFNSAPYIAHCLRALLTRDLPGGAIHVTDNASTDETLSEIERAAGSRIVLHRNYTNLGFCGAHNQGVKKFLDGNWKFFLCLNPDVVLSEDCIAKLISKMTALQDCGCATPKLLRCDEQMRPLIPPVLDAAGMYMTPSLRHLDRGSGVLDSPEFSNDCFVFGGTGACLLMRRELITDLLLPDLKYESLTDVIYPQLASGRSERALLFDEAFFAFREDADLAWRAQSRGWRSIYVASAVAYHVRKVTPEKRSILPAEINLMGVRNRFLMQLNNYSMRYGMRIFFIGYVLRNLIVFFGCIVSERSSLKAFRQIGKLFRRSLERRHAINARAKVPAGSLARWFKSRPYCEPTSLSGV